MNLVFFGPIFGPKLLVRFVVRSPVQTHCRFAIHVGQMGLGVVMGAKFGLRAVFVLCRFSGSTVQCYNTDGTQRCFRSNRTENWWKTGTGADNVLLKFAIALFLLVPYDVCPAELLKRKFIATPRVASRTMNYTITARNVPESLGILRAQCMQGEELLGYVISVTSLVLGEQR